MWHDSDRARYGPPNQMHAKRVCHGIAQRRYSTQPHTHTHTHSLWVRDREIYATAPLCVWAKRNQSLPAGYWLFVSCLLPYLSFPLSFSLSLFLSLSRFESPVGGQWIITCNYFLINYLTALRTTPYCDNFSIDYAAYSQP